MHPFSLETRLPFPRPVFDPEHDSRSLDDVSCSLRRSQRYNLQLASAPDRPEAQPSPRFVGPYRLLDVFDVLPDRLGGRDAGFRDDVYPDMQKEYIDVVGRTGALLQFFIRLVENVERVELSFFKNARVTDIDVSRFPDVCPIGRFLNREKPRLDRIDYRLSRVSHGDILPMRSCRERESNASRRSRPAELPRCKKSSH